VGRTCIGSGITLSADVEGLLRVLGEAREEQLEEGVDVLAGNRAVVHGGAVFGVGEANVDRLVKELQRAGQHRPAIMRVKTHDHVGARRPAVLVKGGVLAFVGNRAWAKFEEQSRRRRAAYKKIHTRTGCSQGGGY
jgi:hypothetical protein